MQIALAISGTGTGQEKGLRGSAPKESQTFASLCECICVCVYVFVTATLVRLSAQHRPYT